MSTNSECFIYRLRRSEDGPVIYVGKTYRLRKRLNEHRQVFGSPLLMEVILSCSRCEQDEHEKKWIAHYRSLGECEKNIANGGQGTGMHSQATREKISKLFKGKTKPPEFGLKISAKTKGVPHNWTPEGWRNAQATHFKQGEGRWEDLPKDLQEKFIAARKKQWDGISKEERARMSTERNLQAWAKRDPEQRKQLGCNIGQGITKRFSEEERQARATLASMKAAEKWHSMTVEQKAEMLARRSATAKANRELKAKAASA